jgi:hypothetical protein
LDLNYAFVGFLFFGQYGKVAYRFEIARSLYACDLGNSSSLRICFTDTNFAQKSCFGMSVFKACTK